MEKTIRKIFPRHPAWLALLFFVPALSVLTPVTTNAAAITITSTQTLEFGTFAAGSGGTVMVTPNGTRSATGGVILVSTASSSAAHFTVSGDAGLNYLITLPANGVVTLDSGGNSMAVQDFACLPAVTGTLVGGSDTLKVGATLVVGASQVPASNYTGTFTVTVEYQ